MARLAGASNAASPRVRPGPRALLGQELAALRIDQVHAAAGQAFLRRIRAFAGIARQLRALDVEAGDGAAENEIVHISECAARPRRTLM